MKLLQYPILAFVPVVAAAAAPVYVQADNCEPIQIQSFQYPSIAEPVLVPSPAETITSDKWAQPLSEPVRKQKLAQDTNGTFIVVVAAPVTPIYIASQPTEPISVTSFQYDDLANPVFVPVVAEGPVTADKWLSAWPQPYFRKKRLIQYGVNCAVAEQADDGLPPVHWIPATNVPVFQRWTVQRRQWLYPVRVSDQLFNTPSTTTPFDWIPRVNQPYPYKRQAVREGPSAPPGLHIVPATETITLDKWNRNYPDLIFRRKRLRDYTVSITDARLLTQGEVIRLDKWAQPQSLPRVGQKAPHSRWIHQTLAYVRVIVSASAEPAVWQNLGTVTLHAADLATVTLLTENLGAAGIIMYEDTDTVTLFTEDTDTVTIKTEDTDTVTIKFEDTDIV